MRLKRGIRRPTATEGIGHSKQEPERAPERQAATTRRPAGRRGDQGGDFVRGTVFWPRPTFEVLAQHRARYGLSMQQIVEEALDDWMKRQGYPPFYPEGWSREGKAE